MKAAHRHETTGIDHRRVVTLGTVSGAVLIGILLVALLLWWTWLRPPPWPLQLQIPPTPRLQAHPRQDLAAVRARQQQRLTTYGWVDESAGIAHIPIARAMSLLVAQARMEQPPRAGAAAAPDGQPATAASAAQHAAADQRARTTADPRPGRPR